MIKYYTDNVLACVLLKIYGDVGGNCMIEYLAHKAISAPPGTQGYTFLSDHNAEAIKIGWKM